MARGCGEASIRAQILLFFFAGRSYVHNILPTILLPLIFFTIVTCSIEESTGGGCLRTKMLDRKNEYYRMAGLLRTVSSRTIMIPTAKQSYLSCLAWVRQSSHYPQQAGVQFAGRNK